MNRSSQAGRTLIELLVAIALGLVILTGVGSLYFTTSQSTRVSGNVASIEESGQIAMTLMGNSVRRAGYSEIAGTNSTARFNLLFNGPHVRGCDGGRDFVNAVAADPTNADLACTPSAVAGRVGDTLAVAFQADSVLSAAQAASLDCVGNNPPTRAAPAAYAGSVPGGVVPVVQNVYFLRNDGNLMCMGNGNPGQPQPLMTNVEDFRVFYGFDRASFLLAGGTGAPPSASSLLSAAELNALATVGFLTPWDFVVSVHVCVLLRTQDAGTAAGGTFVPCPATAAEAVGSVDPIALPADGAFRRAYVQVFTIRSRASQSPIS
jgi:type IV pilus assembly protein PilW